MIGLALYVLAFLRRRQAIGGLLLVFFLQVFVQEAELLLRVPGILLAWNKRDRSVPINVSGYEHALELEIAFLAITTWTVVWAIPLLRKREWRYVPYVRAGLVAMAVITLFRIVLYIGINKWLEALFPAVFLPYFFLSKRVVRVFKTHDWNESVFTSLSFTGH
jgi:hypothetical protein